MCEESKDNRKREFNEHGQGSSYHAEAKTKDTLETLYPLAKKNKGLAKRTVVKAAKTTQARDGGTWF